MSIPKCEYLPMMVDGVRQEITAEGMSWFRRFRDMQEVPRTLMEDEEEDGRHMGFWTQIQSGEELVYRLYCTVAWKFSDCQGLPEPSGEFAILRRVSSAD
jgi:hypothetical protein